MRKFPCIRKDCNKDIGMYARQLVDKQGLHGDVLVCPRAHCFQTYHVDVKVGDIMITPIGYDKAA